MAKPRTRAPQRDRGTDTSCCSVVFWRYVMIFFSLITAGCGLSYVLMPFYIYLVAGYLYPLMHDEIYVHGLVVMFTIGIIVLATSFLACSAAHSRIVSTVYMLLMIVILLLEGWLVSTSIQYSTLSELAIQKHFENDVINRYPKDKEVEFVVDRLQIENKCCGAISFADYPRTNLTEDLWKKNEYGKPIEPQYVPDACCRTIGKNCALRDHPSNIYHQGCMPYLLLTVRENMHFVTSVSLAFIIIHTLACLIGCCVCVRGGHDDFDDENPFGDREQEMEMFG